MDFGTYALVIGLERSIEVEVGAIGEHLFDAGWYAYVGSALGSGGFSRIERHRELSRDGRDVRHWHVDYLLAHEATRIDTVRRWKGVDVECDVASEIPDAGVRGFGSSDCTCRSHLGYAVERSELLDALDAVSSSRIDGSKS